MEFARPYRPPPVAADRLFAWPETFGTRFGIFVDTEEEFDWNAPLSRDHRNVSAMAALPDAHRRFADHGVAVVYLVDHPVAASPLAIDALHRILEDGRSAIGAHLHPWVTPPHDEDVNPHNSFAGNLSAGLEAAKLDVLGNAIVTAFGRQPRIFRAGRYGIGPATWALLAERGYAIDSSVRARFDYSREGGPDFSACGCDAYRAGPDGALLELPLTTMFTGLARRGGQALHAPLGTVPRARGAAARMRLLDRVSLTPEGVPLADAIRAIDVALDAGQRYLNLSYHSPTVVPGMTPYVRDGADLVVFEAWWDGVLDHMERRGVRSVGEAELVAVACGGRATSATASAAGGPVAQRLELAAHNG
jgi:hypothetical protein